jgi:PTS system nitrogen regulatory IIA component
MLRCFRGGTVVQNLESRDKYDAIQELVGKAPVFTGSSTSSLVAEAVIRRERLLSTGLGKGVAVAHGTTPAVSDITIALGISEEGIEFDSFDSVPVHLLFVIANPPHRQPDYLLALSAVTRLVRDDAFREALRARVPAREIERKICAAFSECLRKYNKIPA